MDDEEIGVQYGLRALKTIHVKWTSDSWKYVGEEVCIADSFREVDENLVGYTRWDDNWIANEYKKNNFVRSEWLMLYCYNIVYSILFIFFGFNSETPKQKDFHIKMRWQLSVRQCTYPSIRHWIPL